MRTLISAVIAALSLLTVVTVASADHAWSVYHWPSDNLSPTVVDRTSSSLYDVPAGVLEWDNLDTLIQPQMATANNKGDIKVKESVIRSTSYLGLAGVYLDGDGHITRAEIVLNTRLMVELYGPDPRDIADHVLCQEIGHVLGLFHNRDGDDTGGSPDNTCMNDQGHLGEYTSPNSHDTEQLNAIYGHSDAIGDGGEGGPDCSKNPNAKKCRDGNGQWIIVDVFWAP